MVGRAGAAGPDVPRSPGCVGRARVLRGNPNLDGRQGAFPGVTVEPEPAAIIPEQFGGLSKSALLPYITQISGTVGGQTLFSGVTDVIGSIAIPRVREFLRRRYPGVFIVEVVGSQDLGVVGITLKVPEALPCPTGTARRY